MLKARASPSRLRWPVARLALLLCRHRLHDKDATITPVAAKRRILRSRSDRSHAQLSTCPKTAMKAQGFNVLFDETKSDLQWGRSGLMATAAFLEKNPNTALVVAAATLEAQQKMWTDPDTAAKEFAKFAQLKDDAALASVKAFQGYGSRTMTFTENALKLPQQVLATQNPSMATVDLKKTYDLSFLQKLKDTGFNAKIGAPTS